jgi:hypothetical protein
MVHVDNAPDHNSRMTRNFFEHNPLKRHAHRLYSPDICCSDIYLFGKVNGARTGQEIPDEISLLDAVTEYLNGISTEELQRVFHSWIERVKNLITAEGEIDPSKYPPCHYLM